eukprot:1130660-Prorocentrum_minimum.AAC.8
MRRSFKGGGLIWSRATAMRQVDHILEVEEHNTAHRQTTRLRVSCTEGCFKGSQRGQAILPGGKRGHHRRRDGGQAAHLQGPLAVLREPLRPQQMPYRHHQMAACTRPQCRMVRLRQRHPPTLRLAHLRTFLDSLGHHPHGKGLRPVNRSRRLRCGGGAGEVALTVERKLL